MLGSLFQRPSNAIQATPWGEWTGETGGGQRVSTTSAVQLLTVYGCDRFISDGIATLPIDVYEESDGAPLEVDKPDWIEQPTPDLDRVAWATQVLSSLLLAGNAYLEVQRSGLNIRGLRPLDPTKVTVARSGGRKVFRIGGREHTAFEILHIPGVMFPGSDVGLSPVDAARHSIELGMSAQEYGARFFDSDASMPGVIEVPGELVPEKAREMATSWARSRRRASSNKQNLPGVLQGGATWKPTAITNEQSQFLQTRGFTAAEIAGQMFLIDPSDLGIGVTGSSLTYANITERNLRRVQVTFLPWIVRLERALSSLLPAGRYVKVNVNGLLRGDMKTRFESYKIGLDEDFLQRDEVRAWEELAPLPDKAPAPPSLADQIEAVGQLIRAGFDPQAALAFLGLPPIEHTGLVPVTVTQGADDGP